MDSTFTILYQDEHLVVVWSSPSNPQTPLVPKPILHPWGKRKKKRDNPSNSEDEDENEAIPHQPYPAYQEPYPDISDLHLHPPHAAACRRMPTQAARMGWGCRCLLLANPGKVMAHCSHLSRILPPPLLWKCLYARSP